MKRYKIEYWNGDISKPSHLIQISKSGKLYGTSVWFWYDGIKSGKTKNNNNLWNGLCQTWGSNSEIWFFRNAKNVKHQEVLINFKTK